MCPELFYKTQGKYTVSASDEIGGEGDLSADQKDTIDKVLEHYGSHNAWWLSQLACMEDPLTKAKAGVPSGTGCNKVMPEKNMEEGLIDTDTATSNQQDALQFKVPPIPMVARPYPIIDGTPFDAQWYAEQNPDVVREFGTDTDALWYHYSHYGRYEGREPFPNDMVFPEEIQLPDDVTVTSNAPKDVPVPVPAPMPAD